MKTPRRDARQAPTDPSPEGGQPLYLRVAADLRQAIASGVHPLGTRLPTELELCGQQGISRFTAREAVRVLAEAGLVTRRQRIGTVVTALPGDARFAHDASTVRDLLKYAQDTVLEFAYIGRLALSPALARDFGARPGDEWVYAIGVRHATSGARATRNGRAICMTRLYLNPALKGVEALLRKHKTAVYALIEREYKVSIQRVEQELRGAVLDADDAANLGAEPGAPALRILRRYFSDRGQLLEVADNIHPADRFSYRMELRK